MMICVFHVLTFSMLSTGHRVTIKSVTTNRNFYLVRDKGDNVEGAKHAANTSWLRTGQRPGNPRLGTTKSLLETRSSTTTRPEEVSAGTVTTREALESQNGTLAGEMLQGFNPSSLPACRGVRVEACEECEGPACNCYRSAGDPSRLLSQGSYVQCTSAFRAGRGCKRSDRFGSSSGAIYCEKHPVKGELLGSGGFGEVWSLVDPSNNNRPFELEDRAVAVKTEALNATKKALENEYEVLKQLQDVEGIPKVFAFITSGNEHQMFQQRLGENLHAKGRPMDDRKALELAQQILTVLHKVHSRGFVHRDIKPENMMYGFGSDSSVYLIDFGLAKKMNPRDRGKAGTDRYMSISAMRGNPQTYCDDAISLLYSLVEITRNSKNSRKDFLIFPAPTVGLVETLKKRSVQEHHKDVCKGLPAAFAQALNFCYSYKKENSDVLPADGGELNSFYEKLNLFFNDGLQKAPP